MHSETTQNFFARLKYTLSFRLIVKLFTFVTTTLVLRKISSSTYGTAEAVLLLAYGTIINFCRNGFREAMFKFPSKKTDDVAGEIMVLSILVVLVAFLMSPFVYWATATFVWGSGAETNIAIKIAIVSALVEISSEPLAWQFVMSNDAICVKIDAIANAMSLIATFLNILFSKISVVSFAVSQLVHSASILLCYAYLHFLKNKKKSLDLNLKSFALPKLAQNAYFLFTVKLSLKSLIGILISNLDHYTNIKIFENSKNLGILTFVMNLGQSVDRLFFNPFNEVMRSQLYKAQSNSLAEGNREEPEKIYAFALKIRLFVALLGLAFGPNFSAALVYVVYGSNWAGNGIGSALSAFCIFILFQAVLGVTDAYLSLIVKKEDVNRHFIYLASSDFGSIFQFIFIVQTLRKFGEFSPIILVITKISVACSHSLLLIAFSIYYSKKHCGLDQLASLRKSLPSRKIVFLLLLSHAVTLWSFFWFEVGVFRKENYFQKAFLPHFAVGAIFAAATCFVFAVESGFVPKREI